MIEQEGCRPMSVFNADETGLFEKNARKIIAQQEKTFPRLKVPKNRLTLILGWNTAAVCKIPPLPIYSSDNPRVLNEQWMKKPSDENWNSKLPVISKSHFKAWEKAHCFKIYLFKILCQKVSVIGDQKIYSSRCC